MNRKNAEELNSEKVNILQVILYVILFEINYISGS